MSGDILPITSAKLPFDPDDKIFRNYCCEEDDCECPSTYHSLNDSENWIKEMSGISKDLFGEKDS